jgi:acyl carrier protein
MRMANAESRVISVLRRVFEGKGLPAPELGPETVLDGSLGLDSLDFAEWVVRLDQEFGQDPFAAEQVPQIRTIREMAALYS